MCIRDRANLPNADYLLRPGMFIIATARLATVKNALTVPAKSLLSTQGRFFVEILMCLTVRITFVSKPVMQKNRS